MRGDVSAALLYGSYARGTAHEHSDVDIIFIVDHGFKKEFVMHDGLLFEVLEETSSNLFSFWQKNMDQDRHWYLWKDVKILYERDGEGQRVVEHALSLLEHREPWSRSKIEFNREKMLERLQRLRCLSQKDPGTAAMVLVEFVRTATENWFERHGRFVPSTKVFLAVFDSDCPELGELLAAFYLESSDPDVRFTLVERIIDIVYA